MKKMKEIWNQMQKQHGGEGLFSGSDNMYTFSDVISTGSHLMDDALGIWGIPRGHVVQYAGFESSGKTFLSLTTIAQWQKKSPENWAFFVDAEFTFDATWAAGLGVDLDRLYVYRENRGIQIFERLVGTPGKKLGSPKEKKGILDIELESGGSGLGLIVIDSIAAMQPPQEETSEVGKANMALMARFLPPELRKITPLLSATGVTLIGINQLRMKPGVMYGNPEESPGGAALKHACAQMVHMAKMQGKDSRLESGDETVGHHVRARIDKNKKAPPWRVAEVAIDFTKGIANKNVEVRELGVKYGVILKPNNKTYELDGVKYNGKDAIAAVLSDETLQASVMERVKTAKSQMIERGTVLNDNVDETAAAEESSEEEN